MSDETIRDLEKQIFDLTNELNRLRRETPRVEVRDYEFATLDGTVRLSELFGEHNKLLAIHNMGQGCRYCTLWADGFNPFLPHLESTMSVVMLSKDAPNVQRRFANSRHWRFRMASHTGGEYATEQTVAAGSVNAPGAVCYERDGGTLYRLTDCHFGPGDLYCSMWNLLALAGIDGEAWTPQFNYWLRPTQMDDGGADLLE